MPIDLTGLFEAIWSALRVIPTPIIAIVLLGGPTAAMMGYRLIVAGRRRVEAPASAAALWVCRDCRSVNQLGLSRCYRCGLEQGATEEIELIVDQPASRPAPFEVPAGSPFAAVAVGPGRNTGAQVPAASAEDEPVAMVEVDT